MNKQTKSVAAIVANALGTTKQDAEDTLIDIDVAIGAYLSPAQVDAIEGMIALILERDIQMDTYRAAMKELARVAFPSPVDYDAWREISAQLRHGVSEYTYKEVKAAYKAMHGDLPARGVRSDADKKLSAAQWANSMEARAAKLIEMAAKCPTSARTAKLAALMKAIANEIAAERRKAA